MMLVIILFACLALGGAAELEDKHFRELHTQKKMMPINTNRLRRITRLLLTCLALCRFSAAQMYEENELCDFGTYKGTCLTESKCPELPVYMKELGLKANDVGHCGFTIAEEIICCPVRPAPAPAAKQLPDVFIDILKPPPPEDETTTSSVQTTSADYWFGYNFQNINKDKSSRSNNGNSAANDEETQRFNLIFNTNPIQGGLDTNPLPNESDGAIINAIFNTNPIQGGLDTNPLPNESEGAIINAIFNTNPLQGGLDTNPFPNESEGAIINAISNTNPIQSGIPIQDNSQRFDKIFNANPVLNGNPLQGGLDENFLPDESVNARLNAIFNTNPIQNGIPVQDNSQRFDKIFHGNPFPIGNIISESKSEPQTGDAIGDGAQRINYIFKVNSIPNGNPTVENIPRANGNFLPDESANARINEIYNRNPVSNGSPDIESMPTGNPQSDDITKDIIKQAYRDNDFLFESHSNNPFRNYLKQSRRKSFRK